VAGRSTRSLELMAWRNATDSVLADYFHGENVWSKEWRSIGIAVVLEPSQGSQQHFPIYEAEFSGQTKQFVAGEISNGVWLFYVPEQGAQP
jgi:hypothetical protein